MAQSELRVRLLKDGKIVGFEWHRNTNGLMSMWRKNLYRRKNSAFEEDVIGIYRQISYDSFELGIKTDDEWWFEGDRIMGKVDGITINGVLNAPTWNHGWIVITQGVSKELWTFIGAERIGNIHDNPELLEVGNGTN